MKMHFSILLAILLVIPTEATAQTRGTTAPAPAAAAASSEASQKAAEQIMEYVESNEAFQKKLMDAGVRPPLTRVEDIDKLGSLLPPEMAAKSPHDEQHLMDQVGCPALIRS